MSQRLRNFISGLSVAILSVLSIEVAVQLWHRYEFGAWYSPHNTASRFSEVITTTLTDKRQDLGEFSTQVVHPYLGYVYGSVQNEHDLQSVRRGWLQEGTNFDRVSSGNDVALRNTEHGLEVTSTGDDAFVFITSNPLTPDRRHFLSLDVIADQPAPLQLFYKLSDSPDFREEASKTILVHQGPNSVSFQIDVPVAVDRLRLDFGNSAGRYLVKWIAYDYAPKSTIDNRSHAAATFGFLQNRKPLPLSDNTDQINILITGGSVAANLAGDEFLEAAFTRALSRLTKRKISLFNAAIGAYKQPQQVLALAFFLGIGAKFDIVINIDGFNEVIGPYLANYMGTVYPFFPSHWHIRIAGKGLDSKVLGEMVYLNQRKARVIDSLSNKMMYRSAAAGFFAVQELNDITNKLVTLNRLIESTSLSFEQSGPYSDQLKMEEVISQSIDVWARSSFLMQSMATARDMEYYHILQPNQYLPSSKPFSDEERSQYVQSAYPASQIATVGYPLLVGRGKELSKLIPNYIDATRIFVDEPRTVYGDNCCHFNHMGNEILAEYIVREVLLRSGKLKQ